MQTNSHKKETVQTLIITANMIITKSKVITVQIKVTSGLTFKDFKLNLFHFTRKLHRNIT